jgi:hypothetical protein
VVLAFLETLVEVLIMMEEMVVLVEDHMVLGLAMEIELELLLLVEAVKMELVRVPPQELLHLQLEHSILVVAVEERGLPQEHLGAQVAVVQDQEPTGIDLEVSLL